MVVVEAGAVNAVASLCPSAPVAEAVAWDESVSRDSYAGTTSAKVGLSPASSPIHQLATAHLWPTEQP